MLAEAKRTGIVPVVAPIVDALREDGFWLSDALVAQILAAAGENR